jgi:hypothetical protein
MYIVHAGENVNAIAWFWVGGGFFFGKKGRGNIGTCNNMEVRTFMTLMDVISIGSLILMVVSC